MPALSCGTAGIKRDPCRFIGGMQLKLRDMAMFRKMRTALCGAIVFGVGATAALANDKAANTGEVGGIRIGPLGQVFGTPGVVVAPSQAFGQASSPRARPARKRVLTRDAQQLRKQRGSSTVGPQSARSMKYAEDGTVDYIINCPGLGL
jgi:hypothetical protein